jgi:hypothetical protein
MSAAAMTAEPTIAEPSPEALSLATDLVFEEIQDLAERCASYWLSVREAAHRRELIALAVPLRQARVITREVVELAATIIARPAGGEGGANG